MMPGRPRVLPQVPKYSAARAGKQGAGKVAGTGNEGTAALDKALDVLDAVGTAPGGLTQAELAVRLGLPRTTLYRLLGTLVARGLLRRDAARRCYGLGPRCLEYARAAYAMPDLVAAAGPELRALRDMTGETTYLSTREGGFVVALERVDGAHSQRSHSALGQRKPLHCTSQGKAILAAMVPEAREALVKELKLTAVTPRSITDRRRLHAELQLTATRGWSIDDEENVPGVRCCGAAIVDASGQVRGAISAAGPAFRLSMERVQLLGPEVAEAARRIGAQLQGGAAPAARQGEARAVPGDWAFQGALPAWHAPGQCLLWADQLAPGVHRATAVGDTLLARLEAPIQHLLPQPEGAAVCVGAGWQLCTLAGELQALPSWRHAPASAACLGEGGVPWVCVPDGERWQVVAADAGAPSPGPWRLPEPATAMAWCAASGQLYLAAAGSGTLYVLRPGQPLLRRLTTVPKGSGELGGLAVDAAGHLWAALRGGWSVACFEADGSMARVLPLPVPHPTGLAFGGEGGRQLFITTARQDLKREALEAAPLSGRLFVVDV